VQSVALILECGLGNIEAQLGSLATSIEDLVRIAKTPEQTWSYEQYQDAIDAFRRGLHAEALESVARAISGHSSHPGYKIEHRFHQLVGLIHASAPDPGIRDLNTAEAAYLTAFRYSKAADDKRAAAYCLLRAAQLAYDRGDAAEAENRSREALALHSNAETRFLLGKHILANGGAADEALNLLEAAMREATYYFLLAVARFRDGSVNEFLQHEEDVRRRAAGIRDEWMALVSAFVCTAKDFLTTAIETRNLCHQHHVRAHELVTAYEGRHSKGLVALPQSNAASEGLSSEIDRANLVMTENSLPAAEIARNRVLPAGHRFAEAAKKEINQLFEIARSDIERLRTSATAHATATESRLKADMSRLVSAGEGEVNSVYVSEKSTTQTTFGVLGTIAVFGWPVLGIVIIAHSTGVGDFFSRLFWCFVIWIGLSWGLFGAASSKWAADADREAAQQRRREKQQIIKMDIDREVAKSRQRTQQEVDQARAEADADVKALEGGLRPIAERAEALNHLLERWPTAFRSA
jgi:tetratricopeptide (TPR) repeat protein